MNVTTDIQIHDLQPASRTKSYWAGPDLVLLVTPGGKKQFRIYSDRHALGYWPSVNLQCARAMARDYAAQLARKKRQSIKAARKKQGESYAGLTYSDLDTVPWD